MPKLKIKDKSHNKLNNSLSVAKESLKPSADKKLFAREMHYQVYRIESLLNVKNKAELKQLMKTNPELSKPVFVQFLNAYEGKNVNSFIESSKQKTSEEREDLLNGIRKVIYKAQRTKLKSQVEKNKNQAKQGNEEKKMNEQISKKLNAADLENIERSIAKPIEFKKGKTDMKQIQHNYMQVVNGQRALGTHTQNCQVVFNEAVEKYKANAKKNNNTNVLQWGWRKLPWTSSSNGAKSRANEAIKKAKDHYRVFMGRITNLNKNIKDRSSEIKKKLGVFKGDIRKKLQNVIGRETWAKEHKNKSVQKKAGLEAVKAKVTAGFDKAKEHATDIDKNRNNISGLESKLQDKYKNIKTGEIKLGSRIRSVRDRISKFEKLYGASHPKVKFLKENVLKALISGKDKLRAVKNGTSDKLTDIEEKGQRLDILKSDIVLAKTQSVNQIDLLEAQISSEAKKMDVLTKHRVELHKLLEGMEMSYMAIDEFKDSASKNLDKLTENNGKIIESLEGQSKFLESAKAGSPTIGSSLWNTPGLGKWGVLGGLNLINHASRPIAYVFGQVGALWGNRAKWEDTKTITGTLGYFSGGLNGWLDSGGFSKYFDNKWAKRGMKVLNVIPGIASVGFGFATGVSTLIFKPHVVIDSMVTIFTDWKAFKGMLKEVIHYNDWAEGRYGSASGRTVGDAIVLFFSAGSSAGSAAAVTAGKAGAGVIGKSLARTIGFTKGIALESAKLGVWLVTAPFKLVKGAWKAVSHPVKFFKGSPQQLVEKASLAVEKNIDDVGKYADDIGVNASNTAIRGPLKKIKTDGLGSLSVNEAKSLIMELKKQYHSTSSMGARIKIGKLNKSLKQYIKGKYKLQAAGDLGNAAGEVVKDSVDDAGKIVKETVGKSLDDAGNIVKETVGKSADDIAKIAQEASAKRVTDLLKQKPSTIGGKATLRQHLWREIESLPKGHKSLKALAERYQQLDNYVVSSAKIAGSYVAGASEYIIQGLKNLKLRRVPLIVLKGAATAVWIPFVTLKKFLFGSKMTPVQARELLKSSTMQTKFANAQAMVDISAKINMHVKGMHFGKAIELYQAARIIGKDLGVPLSAMDSSFIAHLHRAMPASINYIGKAEDLYDPAVLGSIPDTLEVDMEYIKKSQKKAFVAIGKENNKK